jgi:predicted transcriptional regulator
MLNRSQVKRIEVTLDDELDQLLSIQARVERRSKEALIRDAVRRQYGPRSAATGSPRESDRLG